jgi:hypothetical protein
LFTPLCQVAQEQVRLVMPRSVDPVDVRAQEVLDGFVVGCCLTCAGAGDVESGHWCEVSSGSDGDFFFAVHHAQVGVFDDDGDDLAGVTWAELDALSGDHDLAVAVRPEPSS